MADIELVIKIPEKLWKKVKDGYVPLGISKYLKNGTPIPDNVTNKGVIKAIFPNGIKIDRSTAYAKRVTEDWLNSPYQKGDKE